MPSAAAAAARSLIAHEDSGATATLPLRRSCGCCFDGIGLGSRLGPALSTTENDERDDDRDEKPQHVVDAGTVGEDNHHTPMVSQPAGLLTCGAPNARFDHMKKALKILLVVAIVGVIGKIIIDNA